MRRLSLFVAAVTAVAIPASVLAVSFSGTAGASQTISCSKLTGNINHTIKITGSKCHARPPAGYGNVVFTALTLAGGGTLNWNNPADNFTVSAPSTTSPGRGTCAHGYTEEISNGTVTAASSDPYDAQLNGTAYSSSTCVNGAGKIKLAPHTSFTL
jgi:hypothetical protein